jgi:glycosyltransferase involved in cell wall biosynthesis
VIAGFATFGTNSLVNYCLERLCTVLAGTRFIYRVSAALPSGNGRWGRALRQRWHALYYRRATILAYGGRAAQEIVQQGCSPDRISIDYNSMDTRQLHRLRQKYETDRDAWQREFLVEYGLERPGYVLFASRIYEAKRVDVLINAWRLVVEQLPSAHLVILGSGEKKADAVRQAADLGSSVTFVNGIYDHDLLARFYILASLVVFPGCASLSTHFAMCFGRPVVCSNRGGNELEYVLDGENGLLFNYGDSRDLAEKLLELLRNSDLRQQYGNRADSLVREKINIDHMVDVIAETIRRVHDGALSSAYCE